MNLTLLGRTGQALEELDDLLWDRLHDHRIDEVEVELQGDWRYVELPEMAGREYLYTIGPFGFMSSFRETLRIFFGMEWERVEVWEVRRKRYYRED